MKWLGDPITKLADLTPRDAARAAACKAEVEEQTRLLHSCYCWRRKRRAEHRILRTRFLIMLLSAYDMPPGGLVDVPDDWIT
jgi:hypothetical protein